MAESGSSALRLSVAVVAYQMERELPRTLRSLSPAYQGLRRDQYEVIVVDNGSNPRVEPGDFEDLDLQLSILHVADAAPSPVRAMNLALGAARGDLIGAFIDGARMASPGLLRQAIRASSLAEHPVIAALSFHLGPDVQMRSVKSGYNQQAEDRLLASIGWPSSGYRLFEIASFAGSAAGGWFAPISESNALFLKRDDWRYLEGFDPGFKAPGGGLCNLDVYRRACERPGAELVVLLGEGTFHQVHGGIATNNPSPPQAAFHEEYRHLRGEPFAVPSASPIYLGSVPEAVLASIEWSARCRVGAGARPKFWSPSGLKAKGRPFATEVPPSLLETIQQGTLGSEYRGVPCLKSPFDLALYSRLIGRLKPGTVVEIGGKHGGSALWFADRLSADRKGARVVSVDIAPLLAFKDDRIDVLRGDARDLGRVLTDEYLGGLERPWLVIEDSAHTQETTRAVLDFFGPRLRRGEYLVVEDGVVAFLPGNEYRVYDEGPSRAVAAYLDENPGVFEMDEGLCDFFGFNVTYNPNGWLCRL